MSTISTSVQGLFQSYVPGVVPDKKLVHYWTNAIGKGDKTMADFQNYMSKNNDYLNHIKLTFTDMYYDHLASAGDEVPDSNVLFENMLVINRDKLLTDQDVWNFISGLPAFSAQYSDIIGKLFRPVHEREPTVQELETFLRRFKRDRSYSIDRLRHDIIGGVGIGGDLEGGGGYPLIDLLGASNDGAAFPSSAAGAAAASVPSSGLLGGDGSDLLMQQLDPSSRAGIAGSASGQLSATAPSPAAASAAAAGGGVATITVAKAASITRDFEIIERYERAFQRNMNVREYVLYIDDLRVQHRASADSLGRCIESLYQTQVAHYNSAKEIMHLYLEKYLTEEAFIAQCLPRVHADPEYLDALRRDVIESQEYRERMIGKLQSIYLGLFGEEMEDEDVSYLFERVKRTSLALVADSLTETVAEFKTENDELLQRIFDAFFEVLDREPDGDEQQSYMALIRAQEGRDRASIEDRIAMDLKDSLEYHDILKRKISKSYAKHHRDTLFPSRMYALLQKVLPVKHMADIDAYIDQVVQEGAASAE